MAWKISERVFELNSSHFNRLAEDLDVERYEDFENHSRQGYDQNVYFSSPGNEDDYPLITSIRTPGVYNGGAEHPTSVRVICTKQETADKIIEKISEKVDTLKGKKLESLL